MSRILLCDTNIIREVLDDEGRIDPFVQHIHDNGYLLALSLIQAVELFKLVDSHRRLADLLFASNAHFFKWWKDIVADEVGAFGRGQPIELLSQPSIPAHYPGRTGREDLRRALAGSDIEALYSEFEDQKSRYKEVMDWLPSTTPQTRTQEATDIDFELHNYGFVLSTLREVSPNFVEGMKGNIELFDPNLFPGAYLHGAYIYYRYILKGMKSAPSDVMDIHQVFYVPYCSKVILEKSMGSILHQLRRERGLIEGVDFEAMPHLCSITRPARK